MRDIYSKGEAGFDEMRESTIEDIQLGALGLAYMNSEDPRFQELLQYHRGKRMAWRQRGYIAIASWLRGLMTTDSEAFLREVCFTSGGPARFARVGVLKLIAPDTFAETIINAAYGDQKRIMMALSIRYEQVAAETELKDEVPWLSDVLKSLRTRVESLPPIAKYHLSNLVERYGVKTLREVEDRLEKC